MKQFVKAILFVAISVLASVHTEAQDLMYLKNTKEPIKVKVYEIGLDEVKYKPWGDTVIPVLVLPRVSISKLVLANGSVFEFKDNPMTDAANYADQHNNAIKVHFLSPLSNKLAFSYERSIKPGRSYELGLGIIGVGVKNSAVEETNPRGAYLRAGYKFISSPDFYLRGMKYAHILKGGYIKPEVIYGSYTRDIPYYSYGYYPFYSSTSGSYKRNVTFGGVIVNFGKQWVYDDFFLFDFFVGLGYGFESYNSGTNVSGSYIDDFDTEPYKYAYLGGTKNFPLAITGGFKLGFLFGKQKSTEKGKL